MKNFFFPLVHFFYEIFINVFSTSYPQRKSLKNKGFFENFSTYPLFYTAYYYYYYSIKYKSTDNLSDTAAKTRGGNVKYEVVFFSIII